MNSKISVVIPYYNNSNTIIRALKSVVNQDYSNTEIILINDGSIDDSYEIVNDFCEKNNLTNIKNIKQENKGPSNARNNGVRMAEGKYIAFLDADDSWEPNKLSKQISIVENNDIDLLGCNFYIEKENSIDKKYFIKDKLKKIEFKDLLYKHYYATPCVICKKSTLIDVGLFDEDQKYMEDSLLFTKIARDYNAYMTNDFLVTTYKNSFGENGLSGNLLGMQKYELKNFLELYKGNKTSNNKMSIVEYASINIFSIIKFIRRIIIVALRKG